MIAGLAVVTLVAGLACVAALVANKRANDAQQQAVLECDRSRRTWRWTRESPRAIKSSTSRLTACSIAPGPSAGRRPFGISTA